MVLPTNPSQGGQQPQQPPATPPSQPAPVAHPAAPTPAQPPHQQPSHPAPVTPPPAHAAPAQPYPAQPPAQPPAQAPAQAPVQGSHAATPPGADPDPSYAETDTGRAATHDTEHDAEYDAGHESTYSPEVQHSINRLLDIVVDDESSEVLLNGPNEVHMKVAGQRYHVADIAFGDAETYHHVLNAHLLPYVDTADRIDGRTVGIQGQMEMDSGNPDVPPMLARVHMLTPPLVQFAKVTIAKKARYDLDLDMLVTSGSLSIQMASFLKSVAYGRLTFVISGPTGAGKTTLLQAMTRYFDQNDRVVLIEDTPELRLPLGDVVPLTSTNERPGMRPEDRVTTEWLVRETQRMRMDRVIVGECRGAEMAEWLIAANSGADGSATTVHADNPRRAFEKMLLLATKSPTAPSETTLRREIASTVDIIIQCGLIDGRNVVTHIEEITPIRNENGVLTSTTLFEYDRSTGKHVCKAAPEKRLQEVLRSRGVPINPQDFILNG